MSHKLDIPFKSNFNCLKTSVYTPDQMGLNKQDVMMSTTAQPAVTISMVWRLEAVREYLKL